MRMRFVVLPFLILISAAGLGGAAFAQGDKLGKEQLDQMLAPIALYPDDLLTNVLMASTYPLDVVAADRWRREPANAKLKGDALAKALEAKEWDPSVKALVQFPDVLKSMSEKLDWTQKLGDAFLAQKDEVMDEIQFLRGKAAEAGNLKSSDKQKVTKEAGPSAQPIYIIEPAAPEKVYVPVYQPTVYGTWWYPSYPPYAWSYPGAHFVNGFFWGAGVAVAGGIWGWNKWDWHHHDIDIDVNKWNNINVNRNKITNNKWEHNPDRRGSVPYKNKEVRDKFKQADRGPVGSKEFRGRDTDEIKSRLKDTDHARIEDRADRGRDAIRDKVPAGAGDKIKNRVEDRPKAANKAARDLDRVKQQRPVPGAFDVKRGADVKRNADRGRASRNAMTQNVRQRGGGGHVGGGHRAGGGRRR